MNQSINDADNRSYDGVVCLFAEEIGYTLDA